MWSDDHQVEKVMVVAKREVKFIKFNMSRNVCLTREHILKSIYFVMEREKEWKTHCHCLKPNFTMPKGEIQSCTPEDLMIGICRRRAINKFIWRLIMQNSALKDDWLDKLMFRKYLSKIWMEPMNVIIMSN